MLKKEINIFFLLLNEKKNIYIYEFKSWINLIKKLMEKD